LKWKEPRELGSEVLRFFLLLIDPAYAALQNPPRQINAAAQKNSR